MNHAITPSGRAVNPWWIGLTLTIATFMELLDTSIANVSLPHIAGGLGTSLDEATWVLTSIAPQPPEHVVREVIEAGP